MYSLPQHFQMIIITLSRFMPNSNTIIPNNQTQTNTASCSEDQAHRKQSISMLHHWQTRHPEWLSQATRATEAPQGPQLTHTTQHQTEERETRGLPESDLDHAGKPQPNRAGALPSCCRSATSVTRALGASTQPTDAPPIRLDFVRRRTTSQLLLAAGLLRAKLKTRREG